MTNEEAIDILTKEIACDECDDFGVRCYDCDYAAEDADLTEALKVAKDVLINWQCMMAYLKGQEVWFSVNYRDAEKHEAITEVIEKTKELEHDPD